jgi:predicted kinase
MLIAMAGLPGAGKSTVAEVVGNRLGYAILSVDPIESAILSSGIDSDQPTGLAAYLVAEAIADAALANGQSVIVDAVNAVEAARAQWRDLAARTGAGLRFIEVRCSDPGVHRGRLEARQRDIAGFYEPSWADVEQRSREFAPWTDDRLTLDSVKPREGNLSAALRYLGR